MTLIVCNEEDCDSSQFQLWTDGHIQCVFCATKLEEEE